MDWLLDAALALAIAALARGLIVLPVCVRGDSMRDTLRSGDRLIALRLPARLGRLRRGDIVICRYPGARRYYIKRLIGLPGETLELRGGEVLIDGRPLSPPRAARPTRRRFGPIELGAGQYFVLGDNRPNSRDSRAVGPLSARDLRAVAVLRVWPLGRAGRLGAR